MAIAAAPNYLGRDFSTASPGLRFGMYLNIWSTAFQVEKEKAAPLKAAGRLNDGDLKLMTALRDRQQITFDSIATFKSSCFQLDAQSVSPFTTGLGNEHPLENGFAFLNPYGLPYLPGSGVKGVLRQAARELAAGAWGDNRGWSNDIITKLFGRETITGETEQQRGALTFWDVIPQIKGDHLQVEIMTPHQSHYYQQKNDGKTGTSISPHDSGQPSPKSFLTVPPGSGFTFHVQCNRTLLQRTAPELLQDEQWKVLLIAAFEHAFDWCGFGAKTAVGYGAMVSTAGLAQAQEKAALRKSQEQQQTYLRKLAESGIKTEVNLWEGAFVKSIDPGQGNLTVESSTGQQATGKFYSQLSEAAKKRIKNKKQVLLDVEIERQGNQILIKRIAEKPNS